MIRDGIAENDPMEAAKRGFWCFARSQRRFPEWIPSPEIRRAIIECELAARPKPGGKIDLPPAGCSVLSVGGPLDREASAEMWAIMKRWPEYQSLSDWNGRK